MINFNNISIKLGEDEHFLFLSTMSYGLCISPFLKECQLRFISKGNIFIMFSAKKKYVPIIGHLPSFTMSKCQKSLIFTLSIKTYKYIVNRGKYMRNGDK